MGEVSSASTFCNVLSLVCHLFNSVEILDFPKVVLHSLQPFCTFTRNTQNSLMTQNFLLRVRSTSPSGRYTRTRVAEGSREDSVEVPDPVLPRGSSVQGQGPQDQDETLDVGTKEDRRHQDEIGDEKRLQRKSAYSGWGTLKRYPAIGSGRGTKATKVKTGKRRPGEDSYGHVEVLVTRSGTTSSFDRKCAPDFYISPAEDPTRRWRWCSGHCLRGTKSHWCKVLVEG